MSKPDYSTLNYGSISKASSFWKELIGDASVFSLESRIFHSISIGIIMVAIIYIPYNLFAGLYVASFSALIVTLFFSWQFRNSRFHCKPHSSTIFGLFGVLLFGINYFFNSGIDGSTDLIWPAYLLLLFAISPYHQHLKWLVTYIVCFLLIHLLEFYHPELILYPFKAGKGQLLDRITAFPMPVLTIYIVIRFIRRSHDLERKAAEEKTIAVEQSNQQILLQKQELEKSNAEKTKLMSIISHDLRTPLMNIQSYLQLLQEHDLDTADRPALESALLSSTNSTVEMLSNLLHWSKSQMSGIQAHIEEISLLETLTSTLEMQKMQALKKGIHLIHDIPKAVFVNADVNMLQLVIRNLISNAIKFTPQGGTIRISAQQYFSGYKITVSDTGKGITAEQLEHLFSLKTNPAFGTNNEKGVGLGLMLCKQYIEEQGGQIGYEPNPSGGAVFFVLLNN